MADYRDIRALLTALRGASVVPVINRFGGGAITGPAIVVLKQDASRIAFVVTNTGLLDLFLIPSESGLNPNPNGIRVVAFGGTLSAQWDEDGEVVAHEWVAASTGGAGAAFVLEEIIQHQQGPTPPSA